MQGRCPNYLIIASVGGVRHIDASGESIFDFRSLILRLIYCHHCCCRNVGEPLLSWFPSCLFSSVLFSVVWFFAVCSPLLRQFYPQQRELLSFHLLLPTVDRPFVYVVMGIFELVFCLSHCFHLQVWKSVFIIMVSLFSQIFNIGLLVVEGDETIPATIRIAAAATPIRLPTSG